MPKEKEWSEYTWEEIMNSFGPSAEIGMVLWLENVLLLETIKGVDANGNVIYPKWVKRCLDMIEKWRDK